MKDSPFFKQAELMLRVIPNVAAEQCFALKGGTAINLFVRDMPRLSVDIDLTYLPIEARERSLKNITDALKRIATSIKQAIPMVRVQESNVKGSNRVAKLFIRNPDAQIKIEPNEVIGALHSPVLCEIYQKKRKNSLDFPLPSIRFLSPISMEGSFVRHRTMSGWLMRTDMPCFSHSPWNIEWI